MKPILAQLHLSSLANNSILSYYYKDMDGIRRFKTLYLIFLFLFVLLVIVAAFFLIKKFFITPGSTQQNANSKQKLTLPCPVPGEFCEKAVNLTYKGQGIGWGFNIPAGTPILTVFPGTLEDGAESGGSINVKSHPVRWLHGKEDFKGYIATYSFYGTPVSSYGQDKMVKPFTEKEIIATSSADSFPAKAPFTGVNLIFSVTRGEKFGTLLEISFK